MTKPWEETWEWQAIRDRVVCVTPDLGYFVLMDMDHDGELNPPALADARGRLAAAAPEMARLLVAVERHLDEYVQHCEGSPPPSENRAKDVHAQVLAVLRKAGVIE